MKINSARDFCNDYYLFLKTRSIFLQHSKTVIVVFITSIQSSLSSTRGYSYCLMIVVYGISIEHNIHEEKKCIIRLKKRRMLLFSLVCIYTFWTITTNLLTHSRLYSLLTKNRKIILYAFKTIPPLTVSIHRKIIKHKRKSWWSLKNLDIFLFFYLIYFLLSR